MIHFAPQYFLEPTHQISIFVIGAGGNGGQAIMDLAKLNSTLIKLGHPGFHVTLFDDDIVEDVNLGRQRFRETDIGSYKSEILISRINAFFNFEWDYEIERYSIKEFGTSNIIITCVDNIATRVDISRNHKMFRNNMIYNRLFYWLDFGNGKNYGQFVLGSINIKQPKSKEKTIGKLKNIIEMFPNIKKQVDENEPSCSTHEALMKQDLFINPLIVTFGIQLLWKLFREYKIDYQGGFLNLETMNLKPIKL